METGAPARIQPSDRLFARVKSTLKAIDVVPRSALSSQKEWGCSGNTPFGSAGISSTLRICAFTHAIRSTSTRPVPTSSGGANHIFTSSATVETMHSAAANRAQATATQILALEDGGNRNALGAVCDKLRHQLGTLVGVVGFRTLLHRSLVIAQKKSDRLGKLSIDENGMLDGIDELVAQSTEAQIREASATLVGQLLILLETFIGNTLTRQLLEEIWPLPRGATEPPETRKI